MTTTTTTTTTTAQSKWKGKKEEKLGSFPKLLASLVIQNNMEHNGDGGTNCNWCARYSLQRTWKLEDKWTPSKLQHCWDWPEYWEESWKLEETCCHSDSSEKPSVKDDVENSQRSKIIMKLNILILHELYVCFLSSYLYKPSYICLLIFFLILKKMSCCSNAQQTSSLSLIWH